MIQLGALKREYNVYGECFYRLRVDGRPKRTKKFAFTIVCVYNRLRVDGALVSFAIECISGHTSHSLHASLLKTATKIAALQRRSQGWQYLKSRRFLLFSVIVSVCNTVTSTNDTTTAPQPRHVFGKM